MSNNTISSTVTFPKEMIINSNLNKVQLELLKSQYQRIQKLAKEELNDNQYQLFLNKNKEVYLPKGSLVWGCTLSNLKRIKNKGILADEFFGVSSIGSAYTVHFYKIDNDILLKEFNDNFTSQDNYPFNNCNGSVAFIINSTSKIRGILYYDILDSKFDYSSDIKGFINSNEEELDKKALILGGVPINAISGIVLGDDVILNDKLVQEIKFLFPKAYIVTKEGNIIKDRSNIIKIEDYEKLSFKCCKEEIKNRQLEKDINLAKKEVSTILTAVINNVPAVTQAKILLAIGHKKLPAKLLDKLTLEEKYSLNLIEKKDKK